MIEFGKYHCAESYDWPAGGREDAGLCTAWYQTLVQGMNSDPPSVYRLLIHSFFRALRVEWRAHEVRDVGSVCGCASAHYAINVRPARRLLKSISIKQGIKYDDPESAHDIPTFIEFHRLDVDEILDPIDSFSKYPRCHLPVLV